MNSGEPKVELLWWRGCPSAGKALQLLRDAMMDSNLDADSINIREVSSDQEAHKEEFIGSPTIRVNGRDIDPPDQAVQPALNCRIYQLRDGRVSPTPDPEDLKKALREAVGGRKS